MFSANKYYHRQPYPILWPFREHYRFFNKSFHSTQFIGTHNSCENASNNYFENVKSNWTYCVLKFKNKSMSKMIEVEKMVENNESGQPILRLVKLSCIGIWNMRHCLQVMSKANIFRNNRRNFMLSSNAFYALIGFNWLDINDFTMEYLR